MKFSKILCAVAAITTKCVYARELQFEKYIETKDFHYNFRCLDNFNDACDVAKEDFEYALDVLSKTFEFYEPINFEVIIDDLSKYGLDNATGGAMDINFVPLKTSNDDNTPPYLYTQAQAKQLNIKTKPNYKKNDFIIVLNNFKIDPDTMEKFALKRYSRLIIHEIIHAMGFTNNEVISEIRDSEEVLPISPGHITTDGSENYKFIPSIGIDLPWDKLSKASAFEQYINGLYDAYFRGVVPLSVFSKNIVDIDTKEKLFKDLGFVYKEFNCFEGELIIKDITQKRCLECYNKLSDNTKKALSNVADHIFKSKSIGFLTSKGTVIPLQTFDKEFHPGSSIIHIQFDRNEEIRNDPDQRKKFLRGTFITKENISEYYNKEALMYYSQADSITNDEFRETIGKDNREGLIGQDTIDILKTLGWKEKGEEKSDEIYYVDDTAFVPEQNSFKYVNMKLYELTSMPQQPQQEQEQEQEQQQQQQNKEQQENKETKKEKETPIPPKMEL